MLDKSCHSSHYSEYNHGKNTENQREMKKYLWDSIFSNMVQPWLIDCQGFFRDRFKFLACHSCFFQRQFYSLLHLFILGDTFPVAFIFHTPEGDEILQAVGLFHVTVDFFLQECYYCLNNLIPMKAFRDRFEHSKNLFGSILHFPTGHQELLGLYMFISCRLFNSAS